MVSGGASFRVGASRCPEGRLSVALAGGGDDGDGGGFPRDWAGAAGGTELLTETVPSWPRSRRGDRRGGGAGGGAGDSKAGVCVAREEDRRR